jgi:glycine hydroxymethyltransferase
VSWDQLRNELHSQRMMGMALDAGGHLTHGFRPNISGKLFDQASYGVDSASGLLDYGAIAAQVREFRPLVLVAGYSAYPRNPNFAILAEIAHDVGAAFMVDMAHFAGLVAGKVLVGDLDPVPHADVVTSTTHKSLRGPRGRTGPLHRGIRTLRRQGMPDGPRWPAASRDGRQGRCLV